MTEEEQYIDGCEYCGGGWCTGSCSTGDNEQPPLSKRPLQPEDAWPMGEEEDDGQEEVQPEPVPLREEA